MTIYIRTIRKSAFIILEEKFVHSKKYYFAHISFHASQIKCVSPGVPSNLDPNLALVDCFYRDWMLPAFLRS